MSASADFRKWLSSDWGRPNFLTRLGIPRISTNLLAWLLWFYVCFLLTMRFVPVTDRAVDKQIFYLLLRNPFILMSYASLYLCFLVREFLSSKYKVTGRALDKSMRENWSDPFVKVYVVGVACMLLLFLIGSLVFRYQLK